MTTKQKAERLIELWKDFPQTGVLPITPDTIKNAAELAYRSMPEEHKKTLGWD